MRTAPDDPVHSPLVHEQDCNGLTKREYFAAMAMQGHLASEENNSEEGVMSTEDLCRASVRFADALISQLNNTK